MLKIKTNKINKQERYNTIFLLPVNSVSSGANLFLLTINYLGALGGKTIRLYL